jgi:putative oxidoreductase
MAPQTLYAETLQMAELDKAPALSALRHRLTALARRALPPSLLLLVQRLGIAAIFFQSGRTKVEGWFTIPDTTYELFVYEYAGVPLPSEFAAVMATVGEHLFPILLVLGLFTRLSALALLGMTLTIQIFVYPDAWPTHLSWAGLLLPLIALGGGRFALDRVLFR